MSYRIEDYRNQPQKPPSRAAGPTPPPNKAQVPCRRCRQPIPNSSTTCPLCGIHFSGGTAYDMAEGTQQKLARKRKLQRLAAWLSLAIALATLGAMILSGWLHFFR